MYRSVLSTHWPTVGCSPPSVPSEEDVAEPDGRAAPSITSLGTERKCPRCLATSGQQAWETLAISSRDVPGADWPGSPGSGVGRGCLRMGGGEVDVQPLSAGRWPVNGLTRGPSMQHVGVLTPRTSEHGWMWRWVFTEGAKL